MPATGPATPTRVDLIRHGEPVGGRRYRGQVDDPLSERGWAQMWQAVGDGCHWDRIITSTLTRCSAFAHALAARHGLPVEADPRLMEVGFGSWEGRSRQDVQDADPGFYARFYADPVGCRPPGAEALEAFAARVAAAFDDVLAAAAGQRVLVVAHAGVIRAVLGRVLDLPLPSLYRIEVANAGLTRVEAPPGGVPKLVFHGGCL